jgi:hypothetical protein
MRSDQPKSAGKKKNRLPEISADLINMVRSFTVLRFTGMLGIRNVSFTKEELLKMNQQLNRIRKPG